MKRQRGETALLALFLIIFALIAGATAITRLIAHRPNVEVVQAVAAACKEHNMMVRVNGETGDVECVAPLGK